MFLRSLSIKGFKSFADATTLVMEPGVTVVVLGELSAKELRMLRKERPAGAASPAA